MELPSRTELRQKNLFSVADLRMTWHDQGHFLCVKVDKHSKSKKTLNSVFEERWSQHVYTAIGGFIVDIDSAFQYNLIVKEIQEKPWARKLIVKQCDDGLLNAKDSPKKSDRLSAPQSLTA